MAYRTLNPYTETVVKTYDPHTDDQVEAALSKADDIFKSDWCQGDIAPRLKVLSRMAELLTERSDDLAAKMAEEMGKPITQGAQEIELCAGIAQYYAENATELLKPQPYESQLGEAWIQHHPVGVLLAVEPWNFPIYQLIRVIAPAIAVGNPVLFKHAGIVPGCAAMFETLVRDAGAPEGMVATLYISSEQVSDLIGDDRIQGVALTGSEGAGSKVAARASEMLKKSTLELGGSDVFVVLDDADVDRRRPGRSRGTPVQCRSGLHRSQAVHRPEDRSQTPSPPPSPKACSPPSWATRWIRPRRWAHCRPRTRWRV